MTVKDLNSAPCSGTFKRETYCKTGHHISLFWFLYIYYHKLVKQPTQYS